MRKFEVGVSYSGYKTFVIEAETREKAMEIAEDDFDILTPIKETQPYVTDVDDYGEVNR